MTDLTGQRGVEAGRLRKMLAGPEPVLAPGAYDGLTARLVEKSGFEAVYMTGFGTAASLLGRPDVGLLTLSEMVDNARRIVQAVGVPVIADADNGYGNPINVIRTVREYETAGVSAIHIEDQVAPKKCGHIEGKQVIAAGEMVEKAHAAVEARRSEDFLIIARTDARVVEGMDGALERARRYQEAGADVLFVEAPESEEEVAAVAEAFPDTPLLFNWVEGGKTPPVPFDRLKELGFRLIIFPISALLVATRFVQEVLSRIRADGTPIPVMDQLLPMEEFLDFIGLPEIRELEERFEDKEVRTSR
ncbi:MAG: 2,3-dimethylmalate lyase [Rubrobacteraceae bacterium]|nr:2,3-dimethylmalate lyase [Rubrobacteraceae bacterium]